MRFSNRIQQMDTTVLRELLALTAKPDIISSPSRRTTLTVSPHGVFFNVFILYFLSIIILFAIFFPIAILESNTPTMIFPSTLLITVTEPPSTNPRLFKKRRVSSFPAIRLITPSWPGEIIDNGISVTFLSNFLIPQTFIIYLLLLLVYTNYN